MPKRYVYVLKNSEIPPRFYTGLTSDVARRHSEHNAGNCTHTAKYRPWCVDVVIEFADERRAVAFERYLKSGSGVAFAQRHLREAPMPGSTDAARGAES
jgi:predicted GIY-YIG superfamily endonuclease